MQLATVGLMCAWLMGGQGTTPASGQGAAAPPDRSPAPADSTARADKPAPAPSASAGRPGGANPNTAEPELPVALPPAATPVVPGTEAPPPPAALKTRLDRVRAENADLPVPTKIEV
ncbi:MAG TPA: hypothetical protein VGG33_05770, partial [Polyangia bacterium]